MHVRSRGRPDRIRISAAIPWRSPSCYTEGVHTPYICIACTCSQSPEPCRSTPCWCRSGRCSDAEAAAAAHRRTRGGRAAHGACRRGPRPVVGLGKGLSDKTKDLSSSTGRVTQEAVCDGGVFTESRNPPGRP
ncbi:hypothetical protein BS78_09G174800 [Paspalum vaginatum]|nr:hypothetical protein BS78_09G174800 [Paspalum vaginatum]